MKCNVYLLIKKLHLVSWRGCPTFGVQFSFQTTFAYPSAQSVVSVRPSFFRAVLFEDFGFNQLVVQVVEIVLHLAIGEFAVDQVAEVVVVIGRAVVGFQAVVGDDGAVV